MWGLLSAIGLAAVSIQHLLDVNNAEMEKQKRDREIRRLQEELEAEQMRKRQIENELDLERLRKTIAESNAVEYVIRMGRVRDMRIELAKIESEMDKNDSNYEEKRIGCKRLRDTLDRTERNIEVDFGEFKPRNMTSDEMYNYYLIHLKREETAESEVAATEEMDYSDEELTEEINKLKSDLADMEINLVDDGTEEYLRDLQTMKEMREKIEILENRLENSK